MRWMILAMVLVLPGISVAQAPPAPQPSAPKSPAPPTPSALAAELFAPNGPLLTVKITVADPELKKLRAEPRKYTTCTVAIGDTTHKTVGIHLKGAAGSFRGWDDKPALTLNSDKFMTDQHIRGMDKFHLNNSVQDGSYMNELTCARIATALRLPTARTTHAIVELNGRKWGLYVLKEGYDAQFVKINFPGASSGHLYDGGFLRDIDQQLELDVGDKTDWKDLKTLLTACRIGDAKKRYEEVSKLVDVDRFVANAALQIFACDWDGYMRNRNNYRVYFPPKDGKAVFIPHGMDQEFGNLHEPIWMGWGGVVAQAILNTPEGKAKTMAALKDIVEKHVDAAFMKDLETTAVRTRDGLMTVNKDWARGFENEAKAQRDRVKQRVEFVKKELAKVK